MIGLGILFSLACSTYKHEWLPLSANDPSYVYVPKKVRITLKDSTEIITVSRGGGFLASWPETTRKVAHGDSAQFKFSPISNVQWHGDILRMVRETGMPPAVPETILIAGRGIYRKEYERVTETKEGFLPKVMGSVLCVHR